jgi:hypothetical protein
LAEFDATILYGLFSPDLKEFIDINLKDECWVIKNTDDPDIQYKITNSVLELPNREVYQCLQAKFVKWFDKNSIKVINMSHEEKFEVILRLPMNPEER